MEEPLPAAVETLLGARLSKVEDSECQRFRPHRDRIESTNPNVQLSVRTLDRYCRVAFTQGTTFFGQIEGEWFRFGSSIVIRSTLAK